MDTPVLTIKKVTPCFDMEEFMNFTHESRISGEAMQTLAKLWTEWMDQLQIVEMRSGNKAWLAIWLPQEIETYVDETWQSSPAEGFMVNSLAQFLCMAAVQEMVPQSADGGCAPMPKKDPALSMALTMARLKEDANVESSLSRRYAVLTYYPFKGGCEICAMSATCPKGQGHGELPGFVLPGHERGTAK